MSGLALAGIAGLAVIIPLTAWSSMALAACAALTIAHAIATARRRKTTLFVDAEGVRCDGPRRCDIRWTALEKMRLRFYSVAPGRERGWFELKLKGEGASILADDRLDGFGELVRHATIAASRGELRLDRATCANLVWLGLGELDQGIHEEQR